MSSTATPSPPGTTGCGAGRCRWLASASPRGTRAPGHRGPYRRASQGAMAGGGTFGRRGLPLRAAAGPEHGGVMPDDRTYPLGVPSSIDDPPAVEFIGMIAPQQYSEIIPPTGPVVDPPFTIAFARAHEDAGFDRVLIG